MADVDNTFTSSKLNNISQCHSSFGKNNQLAKPKLDRWKDLNNDQMQSTRYSPHST